MRFQKPKGQRLHKRFIWITNFSHLWWVPSEKKWMLSEDIPENHNGYSTCCGCRSLRAFKRHLRKHPEIKGKAVLVNRFAGYEIYA